MTEHKFIEKNQKELLFFNEAIEYFNRFDKKDFVFSQDSVNLSPNQLRDQMLNELNNLREIIANHPDLKLKNLNNEERKKYSEFMKFYSVCPLCGEINHYHNLKKFFFDENNQNIKEKLVHLMNFKKNKKLKSFQLEFGIPCCKCFKEFFENK
ncbi:MAG: hypothetical protein EU535_05180 [Promethearchaeota archaeon]|nr:MAG: hypothetical protein EU535_05180 [Candidatus Lokiarchaeota archaeon]